MMKKAVTIVVVLFTLNSVNAQNQLLIPPALEGPDFDLSIDYGSVELFPGFVTQTAGINGDILAPTIIIGQGDVVSISLANNLTDTTTMHWHGVHLPSVADGGPHTTIPPSTTWSPTWTGMDHASTMWYHPHLHHKTYKHIMMGISGFIINKDAEESALDLPRTYGVDDIPLALQTKVMTSDYQFDLDMDNRNMDTLFLANATRNAYFDAPAQTVRLRLLNASLMRSFNVGLSNDDDFWVIASDGGLLEVPVQMNRLLISNAERYEILVDLSSLEGSSVELMNYGSGIPSGVYGTESFATMGQVLPIQDYDNNPLNGADFAMLTINVGAPTANAVTSVPSSLVTINAWDETDVDENRQFTFSPDGGMGGPNGLSGPFFINNNPFDMSVINEVIDLGNKEIWTLTNQSMIAHPFHIHDIQFNILEINGAAPPPHQAGWKDVVLVPAQMGTAKFIAKFEDFADPVIPFMYHCHIVGHEEEGMMGQFTVVDDNVEIETIENNQFLMYPNPSTNQLHIQLINSTNSLASVFDVSGQLLLQKKLSTAENTIDVSNLPLGTYFIRINNATTTFIKQ
jgi:blue copper oxidase